MHLLKKPVPLPWLVRIRADNEHEGGFYETKREAEKVAERRKRYGKFAEVVYRPGVAERVGYL